MSTLFQRLETVAARGAEGLASASRARVAAAVRALQQADGGFAGLDGRSDLYYSLFAWLNLRALAVPYDGARLCAYAERGRRASPAVDARCAELLLSVEGRRRVSRRALVVSLLRGDAYGVFLWLLAAEKVPPWLARQAARRAMRRQSAEAVKRLPTPRLAAGLVLAHAAGLPDEGLAEALEARRCPGGGFASAPGASADLLATAAARFALGVGRARSRDTAETRRNDLNFVEACWLEDGLFGASPDALRGDAEHTFYGLLALGTCR